MTVTIKMFLRFTHCVNQLLFSGQDLILASLYLSWVCLGLIELNWAKIACLMTRLDYKQCLRFTHWNFFVLIWIRAPSNLSRGCFSKFWFIWWLLGLSLKMCLRFPDWGVIQVTLVVKGLFEFTSRGDIVYLNIVTARHL